MCGLRCDGKEPLGEGCFGVGVSEEGGYKCLTCSELLPPEWDQTNMLGTDPSRLVSL